MVSLHGDSVGNIDKDNSSIFSLTHMCYLSVSKDMWAVILCSEKILQFLLE